MRDEATATDKKGNDLPGGERVKKSKLKYLYISIAPPVASNSMSELPPPSGQPDQTCEFCPLTESLQEVQFRLNSQMERSCQSVSALGLVVRLVPPVHLFTCSSVQPEDQYEGPETCS